MNFGAKEIIYLFLQCNFSVIQSHTSYIGHICNKRVMYIALIPCAYHIEKLHKKPQDSDKKALSDLTPVHHLHPRALVPLSLTGRLRGGWMETKSTLTDSLTRTRLLSTLLLFTLLYSKVQHQAHYFRFSRTAGGQVGSRIVGWLECKWLCSLSRQTSKSWWRFFGLWSKVSNFSKPSRLQA